MEKIWGLSFYAAPMQVDKKYFLVILKLADFLTMFCYA